jgi:hypothetical protein
MAAQLTSTKGRRRGAPPMEAPREETLADARLPWIRTGATAVPAPTAAGAGARPSRGGRRCPGSRRAIRSGEGGPIGGAHPTPVRVSAQPSVARTGGAPMDAAAAAEFSPTPAVAPPGVTHD